MRTLRTLCSGGELFGVGARAAGYTHVDGYEIDPKIAPATSDALPPHWLEWRAA